MSVHFCEIIPFKERYFKNPDRFYSIPAIHLVDDDNIFKAIRFSSISLYSVPLGLEKQIPRGQISSVSFEFCMRWNP